MKFGLEKEGLLYDEKFCPKNYKKEELDENITLDFANNQLEIVSSVHDSSVKLVDEMINILNNEKIINYNLWPLSTPPLQSKVKYDGMGKKGYEYRCNLLEKYPINKMLLSGIHYNFSFEEEINYFKMYKKMTLYLPILLQFFAYTPVYEKGYDEKLLDLGLNQGLKYSISLRNSSEYGFSNWNTLDIDYTDELTYRKSISKLIRNKKIIDEKEIYAPIRLKDGYIELRFLDINPYKRLGISIEDLELLRLCIEYIKDIEVDKIDVLENFNNFNKVSLNGKDKSISIKISNVEKILEEHTIEFIKNIISKLEIKEDIDLMNSFLKKYQSNSLDANKFQEEIKSITLSEFGYENSYIKEKYIHNDINLELSTKILIDEAQKENLSVEVLDYKSNTIRIDKKNIIVQATKTNLDKYANVLVMENKILTKLILKESKINVPDDVIILKDTEYNIDKFCNKKIVIKPDDTNFGLGITILDKDRTLNQINDSIKLAFEYSDRIMIEEFFEGLEYRFLIIDNEVVSIVKRSPANVIGDGIKTIKQLINEKNTSDLRAKGYTKPLEKINIDSVVLGNLKELNLSIDSIIDKDIKINLRKNSNISTGGESEEVIDKIPQHLKDKACEVTKTLGVAICGIDMMIDLEFKNYTIIEANFNPAIQIHTFPYTGIGKNVAANILKLIKN